ncbi:MAG: hypothetical protein MI866_11095 [Bacteroidales bacterium]|nr:hypothetical protein [Bacteroidales bacterium]
METVFQHNITQEEKKAIGISFPDEVAYLKIIGKETALFDLAFLYSYRKDIDKAEYYANKLPEEDKIDCLRTIHHP